MLKKIDKIYLGIGKGGKVMNKFSKWTAKILIAMTIIWCATGLNSDIVNAKANDYIDWKGVTYVDLLNLEGDIP